MKFFSKKSKWLSQAEYRSRAELIGKMIWPTTGKKSPGGGNNIIMLDSEDSDGNKLSYEDVVGESFVQKNFIKAFGKKSKESNYSHIDLLLLIPEVNNEFDKYAVSVRNPKLHMKENTLGYFPKEDARVLQELILRVIHETQSFVAVEGNLKGGWKSGLLGRNQGDYGIDLHTEIKYMILELKDILENPQKWQDHPDWEILQN